MSSMVKYFVSASFLILPASAITAQQAAPQIVFQPGTGAESHIPNATTSPAYIDARLKPQDAKIASALARWRDLRDGRGYGFSDYAAFLMEYPDWPAATEMRKRAEQAIPAYGYSQSQLIAFFDRMPPVTNGGRVKYALALHDTGNREKATHWARLAWHNGTLGTEDETALLRIMASGLTPADYDLRSENLMWQKSWSDAERLLPYNSDARRPAFAARLAMARGAPDAEDKYLALGAAALSDPDILAERAMMLRRNGTGWMARDLLANRLPLSHVPAAPEKWYEILLLFAREAANDRQYETAYRIASKIDDAIMPGLAVVDQSLGVRDDYTSLAWLAGTTALEQLGRPADAVSMFEKYANAARSPQTRTKGFYWAGLAAKRAGNAEAAQRNLAAAGEYFDQFYGQLAREMTGQPLPAGYAATTLPQSGALGTENPLFAAARVSGITGDHKEQTLFLRAIANQAENEADFANAIAFSRNIGRPDLAVMAGRNARVEGVGTLIPHGFPTIALPADQAHNFTLIHSITRQESQFDRQAISHAGARGLMQLMPGTARETSGKIQMSYSREGLTEDPEYNIRLGSTYIGRMMDYFGGSYPLAIAAYNAGPGNVNKWLRANGDPRRGEIDIVDWIEKIPLSETRNYVQRVLENAVIYDWQNPAQAEIRSATPLNRYLGRPAPR